MPQKVAEENQLARSYVYGLQCVGIGWLAFYAFVVLSAQAVRYLREGEWIEFSTVTLLSRLGIGLGYSNWPYLALSKLPASGAFALTALIWAGFLIAFSRPSHLGEWLAKPHAGRPESVALSSETPRPEKGLAGPDMDGWYYEAGGKRIGPITREDIDNLYRDGKIHENTLVWNKSRSSEWQKYSAIAVSDAGPPPIPASKIKSTYAWQFALVPIIGAIIEMSISSDSIDSDKVIFPIFFTYGAAYVVLGSLDARQIRKSGRNPRTIGLGWLVWLAPAYLFQRARVLGQKQLLLGVWILAFISGLAISNYKDSIYLGETVPTCEDKYTKSNVQNVFEQIPLVKEQGVALLEFEKIEQVSTSEKIRTCRAKVTLTDGNSIVISYVITKRVDDIYFQVQVLP